MPNEDDSWPYEVTETGSEGLDVPQDAAGVPEAGDPPQVGGSEGGDDSDALDRAREALVDSAFTLALDAHGIVVDDPDWMAVRNGFAIGYFIGARDSALGMAAKSHAGTAKDVTLTRGHLSVPGVAYLIQGVVIVGSPIEQFPLQVWEQAGWSVTPHEG